MKIQTVKQLYFSPTGTTKTIVHSIAKGINLDVNECIDLTFPGSRDQEIKAANNDLIIAGVPVYMGRVPALLIDSLQKIKGDNTPAIAVVVYGNRVYDDALIELRDILVQCGCRPIAAGAWIGEHSFSSHETPIAAGRPDTNDLHHAELFGFRVHEKLIQLKSASDISPIEVPGVYPYRGVTKLWDVDFIEVSDECTECGICAEKCPTGAIDTENARITDTVKCITCCACIKCCPQMARSIKPGPVRDAAERLHTLFKERKEPEFFI